MEGNRIHLELDHLEEPSSATSDRSAACPQLEVEARERSRSNLLQNKGYSDSLDPDYRSQGKSAQRAATLLGVSTDATQKAAKVTKSGAPELVEAVQSGDVSLDAAAAVTELPVEEQREVVKSGKVKEKAKEMRAEKTKSKAKPKGVAAPNSPDSKPDQHDGRWTSMSSDEALLAMIQDLTAARATFAGRDEELVKIIDMALSALQGVQRNRAA